MIGKLEYGKRVITFSLEYKRKRNLSITVTPNCEVIVRPPLNAKREKIEEILKKRAKWIAKHLDIFRQNSKSIYPNNYISGETHYYLGKAYRLKVLKRKDNYVTLKNKYIAVSCTNPTNKKLVKSLLEDWYTERAGQKLQSRLNTCYEKAIKLKVALPLLKIRRMRRRWGSCNVNGKISLNPELIKVPIDCIDYVIIHELCHLRINNHSKEYYKHLGKTLPNWKQQKEKLEFFFIRAA